MKFRTLTTGLLASALALLTACATSVIQPVHPLYASANEEAAKVYFYRPLEQRTRGISDNDIKVEIDGTFMMDLSVGEYVLVNLKPGKDIKITMRNMSFIAAKPMPEEVYRSRKFEFDAGKTYYIEAQLQMEEFRGVYFRPMDVDFDKLKATAKFLKPAGPLAIAKPLS